MALYFIGLGLKDEKDISVRGLELVKKSDKVYLESYTAKLQCPKETLESFYGKKIITADRKLVESDAEQTMLAQAKTQDVAFLVVGDVFSATTHTDLYLRAKELELEVEVVNNSSVMTAIGITGLSLYKFGKTTSIPLLNENVETPYNVLKLNQENNMHTLLLLDLQPENLDSMPIKNAIEYLLSLEEKKKEKVFTKKTLCVGCARLTAPDQKIKAGTAEELLNEDFGTGMMCLIVPSKMHFMEEEALKLFS